MDRSCQYMRFQTRGGLGLFQLADAARASKRLNHTDRRTARELFHWFNKWLRVIDSDVYDAPRSTRVHTWFKCTTTQFTDRAAALAVLARRAGFRVRCLRTRDPGVIIFEDEHQVVAQATKVAAIVTPVTVPKRNAPDRRNRQSIRSLQRQVRR